MLRGTTPQSERFLAGIDEISRRMNRAQREITSGKRINTASDAPADVARLLGGRAELDQVRQTQSNLGRVKNEADTAEQALQQGLTALDRILVLGAQGATSLANADLRQTLSDEVGSLLERLVGLSNVAVEGRFLFAGDADHSQPYTFDPTQTDPVSSFAGVASTRETLHPAGTRIRLAATARDVFDSATPEDNVFRSVNELRTALANNDSDGIRAAVGKAATASRHLNNQLAYYGGVQNQVNAAIEYASQEELRLLSRISGIEDADLAAAVVELTQARFHQDTAFQAEAQRPRQSLFNFLG